MKNWLAAMLLRRTSPEKLDIASLQSSFVASLSIESEPFVTGLSADSEGNVVIEFEVLQCAKNDEMGKILLELRDRYGFTMKGDIEPIKPEFTAYGPNLTVASLSGHRKGEITVPSAEFLSSVKKLERIGNAAKEKLKSKMADFVPSDWVEKYIDVAYKGKYVEIDIKPAALQSPESRDGGLFGHCPYIAFLAPRFCEKLISSTNGALTENDVCSAYRRHQDEPLELIRYYGYRTGATPFLVKTEAFCKAFGLTEQELLAGARIGLEGGSGSKTAR